MFAVEEKPELPAATYLWYLRYFAKPYLLDRLLSSYVLPFGASPSRRRKGACTNSFSSLPRRYLGSFLHRGVLGAGAPLAPYLACSAGSGPRSFPPPLLLALAPGTCSRWAFSRAQSVAQRKTKATGYRLPQNTHIRAHKSTQRTQHTGHPHP